MFLNAEPARTGRYPSGERARAQGAPDHLGRDRRLVLEVGLGELVVELGDTVDQRVVSDSRRGSELLRDLFDRELRSERVRVRDRLHLDQVDDSRELLLAPDREMNRYGLRAEPVAHGLDGRVEVGAGAVHLVDERDAGHGVAVCLAPDGLGLGLHSGDGVEDGNGAV